MLNLRTIYYASEERTRCAVLGLCALLALGVVGVVFLSPSLTLALVAGLVVTFVSVVRPEWSLAMLLFYLPFEPFLLKWVPDDVYVYARYASEMLVYLLCAVVLWRLFSGAARWQRTPIDVPFVAFAFLLLATTLINFHDVTTSVLGLRQILRFMLLYFVTVQIAPSKAWLRTVLCGLAMILCLQIVLGVAQAAMGEPIDAFLLPSERRTLGEIQLTPGTVQFWDPGQRVFGTMGRYDQLGTFMAFVMLFIAAGLYEWKRGSRSARWWWLLLAAIPVLALTYSRSAWFGFVLGFMFIAIWAKNDKRVVVAVASAAVGIALYLAVSGLAVSELVDLGGQSFVERFFEAFSAERWTGEYFGLGRMFWIVHTIITVVPAAFLFGFGPASYGGGAVSALRNTRVYDELGLPFGVYGTEGYIDNNWFSLWGETGTLGLLAFLWIYVTLFVLCVRVWRKSHDDGVRALSLGMAGAMLAVALNAFLATYFEVRTLAPYLWVMAGMVTVLGQRKEESEHL